MWVSTHHLILEPVAEEFVEFVNRLLLRDGPVLVLHITAVQRSIQHVRDLASDLAQFCQRNKARHDCRSGLFRILDRRRVHPFILDPEQTGIVDDSRVGDIDIEVVHAQRAA